MCHKDFDPAFLICLFQKVSYLSVLFIDNASLCCLPAPYANKPIYNTHLPGFWVSLYSSNQPELNLLSNV